MELYTVVIETQSIAGDTHESISGVFETKEEALEVVEKFNSMGLSHNHKLGYPEAKLGSTLKVGKTYIDFDELKKFVNPDEPYSVEWTKHEDLDGFIGLKYRCQCGRRYVDTYFDRPIVFEKQTCEDCKRVNMVPVIKRDEV